MAKDKKARKPKNSRLAEAETAFKNAKSDQEKAVARGKLKIVRFEILATARVNKILAALDGLKKLSNRGSYTYTDEQVRKIADAISAKGSETLEAFSSTGKKAAEAFTL